MFEYFKMDPYTMGFPLNMGMHPLFEPVTLEEYGDYKIWRDELGAVRKDFKVIENEGFVTRSWQSFYVSDQKTFREMTARYNPVDPGRMPANFADRARAVNESGVATHLSIPFLFWAIRDWMGFENLCMAFYDQPALVHEMFEFLTDFVIETLKPVIGQMDIDLVEFKEDMAYKHAPMVSPDMFKTFMYPHYVRLISFLKGHGVRLVYVDCDGYPGGLIPHWIEAGVDAVSPNEIAAGNDIAGLQRAYPKFALFGGVDKRELAKDRRAVYDEVAKIPALIEKGGYIPHVDHAIPHDISFANYAYFRELMARIADGSPLGPFKV
jgi:uroporphyrinogen decarboxylase